MNDTTVYVVQDSPGKNLLPAKEFGNLRILLTNADVKKGPKAMGLKLQAQMKDIQPQDYVLLIGDPIAIGMAMHIAMSLTHGIVRVLRWDRNTYSYEQVTAEVVL